MGDVLRAVDEEITRLTKALIQQQREDGSWHFCFENGTVIDAYVIILFRVLGVENEALIRQLHDRILAEQQPEGCWKWFFDEAEGNLSASVEAYYALLYSGYSQAADEPMQRAKRYILSQGGLGMVTNLLTKAILAATGQRKWPKSISLIPLEFLLLPADFPMNFFDFSGYSRVHLTPMLIMADKRFSIKGAHAPDLSDLTSRPVDEDEQLPRGYQDMLDGIQAGLNRLIGTPHKIHKAATAKAEQFMLERTEADGTLYSYASSTILMIFALLALGYDQQHPLITRAIQGLTAMQCRSDGTTTIQNSPSTVWDTALLAYALQESGMAADHPTARRAASYLLSRQQHKTADWSLHNPDTPPGGWGFSETNTLHPDVDDTTAALRAIAGLSHTDPACLASWNRGLNWVISMQNNDGGWPAFEKNTNHEMLTWLAIDGAKSAAIDPSEADLTGRTLEYLGNFAGLDTRLEWIQRGTRWLLQHQEKDGSWYGRWGVCYIYGTWAALTGLAAVGLPASDAGIQKGTRWLLTIQNPDGGWGESCHSDRLQRYLPLGNSTPSQTAWALDALIAVHTQPTSAVNAGIRRLIALLHEDNWKSTYPTGAGLPGHFYTHYHSYRYIWPLLALSHYQRKYGDKHN
ncbi:squalene--hopene cyclase [Paenibacillus woosongensis]|uniref:Squalene--hopene cyclase n=1 Tax=Paenibacillus woosongensis TaxID=307580 RepID=A0AA95I5K7_9BACL|nr:squalene--hopene cyclase [Paenibacillus woosongensis]WHX49351.1 squalene--hopene cyclase [Paenibacillus woosongensis]